MPRRTGRGIGLVVLALVVGVFAAPPVFSAAPPRIVGTLKVGGVASVKFTGRVSAYQWVMCTSVSGLKCLRQVKIGNAKTVVVPASAAGRPLMVSVKVKKRWLKSAWSRTVAAASTPVLGAARTNPFPFGQAGRLGNSWTMTIVSYTPDSTAAVLAENMFNEVLLAAGNQFAIVRVRATYTGSSTDNFDGDFRLRAVGASNVALSTFENPCGVIPDEISDATLFSGGTVEGNICFQIPISDAGSLMVYDDYLLNFTSNWNWFSLS